MYWRVVMMGVAYTYLLACIYMYMYLLSFSPNDPSLLSSLCKTNQNVPSFGIISQLLNFHLCCCPFPASIPIFLPSYHCIASFNALTCAQHFIPYFTAQDYIKK